MNNIYRSPDAPAESGAQQVADVAQEVINTAAPIAAVAGPDGQLAVLAAQGALMAYKSILSLVQQLNAKGVLTAAQQQAIFDNHQSLDSGSFFSGPEWQITK